MTRDVKAAPAPKNKTTYTLDGQERQTSRAFYRGDLAFYMPHQADMLKPRAVVDHILKGWLPEKPFISAKSDIVAFGSCFAANIGRYLANIGFGVSTAREGNAYVQSIGDGLVNVHAICQQFEWAWENRVPEIELWHGWKVEDYGYDESVRLATKALFDHADVFILTFGLSEIWYDEPTGEVFWRAVPADKFDPSRHKFRLATLEETAERMRRIYSLIRKHRPEAAIIMTLSPIGLAATFRQVTAITANSVSKAILRAGIDALYREVHDKDPNFYYYPSYEVVMEGFRHSFLADRRHVQHHVLDANMKSFERYFCQTGMTDEQLEKSLEQCIATDEELVNATDKERRALHRAASEEMRATKVKAGNVRQISAGRGIGAGKAAAEAADAPRLTKEERQARRAAKAQRIAARQERQAARTQRQAARAERQAARAAK